MAILDGSISWWPECKGEIHKRTRTCPEGKCEGASSESHPCQEADDILRNENRKKRKLLEVEEEIDPIGANIGALKCGLQ